MVCLKNESQDTVICRYGMVWYGMVWYDTYCFSCHTQHSHSITASSPPWLFVIVHHDDFGVMPTSIPVDDYYAQCHQHHCRLVCSIVCPSEGLLPPQMQQQLNPQQQASTPHGWSLNPNDLNIMASVASVFAHLCFCSPLLLLASVFSSPKCTMPVVWLCLSSSLLSASAVIIIAAPHGCMSLSTLPILA